MTAIISSVKSKIKDKLDALKTAGTLGQVIVDDLKVDPFTKDIGAYPVAILGTGSIANEYLTNRENLRVMTYEILVIQKAENISAVDNIEELMEAIINSFDNDPTLGGVADGAVDPSTSEPAAIGASDQTFIVFTINIRAKATKELTF